MENFKVTFNHDTQNVGRIRKTGELLTWGVKTDSQYHPVYGVMITNTRTVAIVRDSEDLRVFFVEISDIICLERV